MTNTQNILIKDLDCSKISFGKVTDGAAGGKYVPVLYNGGRFTVEFPKMVIPFDPSPYKDNKKINMAYAIDPTDAKQKVVLDKILEYEECIKKFLVENSVEIFKSKKKEEIISEFMKSRISYPKDGKYNPYLTTVLRQKDGQISSLFFDSLAKGKKMDVSESNIAELIPYGSLGRPILSQGIVWIVDTKISAPWTNVKAMITKNENATASFQDNSDEEDLKEDLDEDCF